MKLSSFEAALVRFEPRLSRSRTPQCYDLTTQLPFPMGNENILLSVGDIHPQLVDWVEETVLRSTNKTNSTQFSCNLTGFGTTVTLFFSQFT